MTPSTNPVLDLSLYGWDASRSESSAASLQHRGLVPGRVVAQHKTGYDVVSARGPLRAQLAGRLRHATIRPDHLPTVGDWVALAVSPHGGAIVQERLERGSSLSRKAAGPDAIAQVLAANVDVVLITAGLDTDPNARRLERYVTAVWESGALPLVVPTKTDLCPDLEHDLEELRAASPGVAVYPVCAPRREGLEPILEHLGRGKTAALVGPSGAGKSTLTNALLGADVQATGANRASDGRGRHTTTGRHLLLLPDEQGCLIDTPGLRELGLWDDDGDGVGQAFPEIDALAGTCRFRDCGHDHEPGCAVAAALEAGELDPDRLASYGKLQRELAFVRRKANRDARRAEGRRWKRVTKAMRQRRKLEGW